MKKKSEKGTNYSSLKFLVWITVLGLSLLTLGIINVQNGFLKFLLSILKEVGALLIISGGVGYFWDTKVKRSFMEEILEKVGIEHDIQVAGIIGTGNDIFKILDEKELLTERTYHIDILMHYVKDWPSIWHAKPRPAEHILIPKRSISIIEHMLVLSCTQKAARIARASTCEHHL